jgi:DNA sulfur modification protein DndB
MPNAFHEFPSLRGKMLGREVYSFYLPTSKISKLALVGDELPFELRAGRIIDNERKEAWISALRKVQISAPIPPIVVAVRTGVEFRGGGREKSVGTLRIPTDAAWFVQSEAGVVLALRSASSSGKISSDEGCIAIMLYVEVDLDTLQAGYRLLQHRGPISRTRRILASEGDPLAEVARELASKSSPFAGVTEMQKSTLAPRAKHLFTLSSIFLATRALLQGQQGKSAADLLSVAREFWMTVADQIPEWNQVRAGTLASGELRAGFLHAHAVVLHSIGRLGAQLIKEFPSSWKKRLTALNAIDWRRTNVADWEGRALIGGSVAYTNASVLLTTNFLKTRIGIELSAEEAKKENTHASLRAPRSRNRS